MLLCICWGILSSVFTFEEFLFFRESQTAMDPFRTFSHLYDLTGQKQHTARIICRANKLRALFPSFFHHKSRLSRLPEAHAVQVRLPLFLPVRCRLDVLPEKLLALILAFREFPLILELLVLPLGARCGVVHRVVYLVPLGC